MMVSKTGILLINLGTPDNCKVLPVARYLKQFLQDPRVIDLTFWFRWLLVNFVIVPFRTKKTTEAYQKIWLKEGSPLLIYSTGIKEALSKELGDAYQVELGMRYGKPSIGTALKQLNNCKAISVLPLFPQYSSAATGSAIAEFLKNISKQHNLPNIQIKKDFYNDPNFIEPYAEIIRKNIEGRNIDLLLFSYHGLPLRHIIKANCKTKCDSDEICPSIDHQNLNCYRAQCYATSHLLANHLNLKPQYYKTAFQSRLGTTPWIKPYTDRLLPKLIQQGIKNIAIVCPSFIVDCLETLEEVNIRAREQWQTLGGQEFIYIPCPNADPLWIKALANICKKMAT